MVNCPQLNVIFYGYRVHVLTYVYPNVSAGASLIAPPPLNFLTTYFSRHPQ